MSWSVVVLPDTQVYSKAHPELFHAQTRFAAEHRDHYGIAAVLHAGDVTDDNSEAQWAIAAGALGRLDGEVPYAIALGNHDYGEGGSASSRDSRLHASMPFERFGAMPTFGGSFEEGRADNTWHRLATPDGPWLVVALEFGPRDAVVDWARGVLLAHRAVPAMLVTHAYLYSDGTRYHRRARPDQRWSPHAYGVAQADGGVNDGEALWRKLVEPCSNVRLVFCGHVLNEGVARRTDVRPDGTQVHQLLANYQTGDRGGASLLRLVRFVDGGRRALVRTRAPFEDRWRDDPANAFDLDLTRQRPGSG